MSTETPRRFALGLVVATPRALAVLSGIEIGFSLLRHASGDWGELDPEDQAENERSLEAGRRLLSAYRAADDVRFWIITEADRSVTTILLPEEY